MAWRVHGWTMCVLRERNKYDKIKKLVRSWRQPVNYDGMSALIYGLSLASAKDYGHIFQLVGLYEDLVNNPSATIEHLFKNMGIDEDSSVGLPAMLIESQMGTFSYTVRKEEVSSSTVAYASQINRDFHLNLSYDCTIEEFRRFLHDAFPNAKK